MAFGEAVFAEPLDLPEAACGEVGVVAAGDHAFDELVLEAADRAAAPEGGHRTAQAVGLGGSEACGDDGNPHGLFLEQGYAECLAQDGFKLCPRVDDGLVSLAATQIRMDHAALDGARADDRNLDHEIVELPRSQAWQHGHLCAALDLEDAEGIGAAQHVVDGGFFPGDGRERGREAVMVVQHCQGLAHAGEHAEREHVDLEDAEGVEVVLVPFDDRASFHGGIRDGDQLVEASPCHHEAADMLGEVAREVAELAGQCEREAEPAVGRVEAEAPDFVFHGGRGGPVPERACEGADGVFRKAEDLAHVADGAAAPVADDRGGEACAVASVAGVDVLDDFLAALVLEVDVDVWGLAALGRDEALEQEVDLVRVDFRDVEAVADGRVRSRAAALAEDPPAACKAHDVVDGQEIGCVVEFGDEPVFVVQSLANTRWNAARIALCRALFGERHERFLWRGEAFAGFLGVFVAQVVEREAAGFGKPDCLGNGLGVAAEQAGHLGGRLEVSFGVGLEVEAGTLEGRVLADAGKHVLEGPACRRVVEGVSHGDHGDAVLLREGLEAAQVALVVAAVVDRGAEPELVARQAAEGCLCLLQRGAWRHEDELEAFDVFDEVVEAEDAVALFSAAVAERQEAAEAPPRGPVTGIGEDVRRVVAEDEACAHEQAQAAFGGFDMGAHDAGDRVPVSDADG